MRKAVRPASRRLTDRDIAVRALWSAAAHARTVLVDNGFDEASTELLDSMELAEEAFGEGLFRKWEDAAV